MNNNRRGYNLEYKRSMVPYIAVVVLMVVAIIAIIIAAIVTGGKKASNANNDLSSIQTSKMNTVSLSESSHSSSVNIGSSKSASSGSSASSTSNISLALSDWRLLLANSQNLIPQDFSPNMVDINHQYCNESGYALDTRAVDKANQMCADAKKDGQNILVLSAYRSIAKQTTLYNNKVQYYKDQGYSDAKAREKAATIVARPRTSDHNLGLAIDVCSLETSFEKSPQFRWLSTNAAKYGFVLRYPKDKQDITGVTYEPWHYRYVGEEHAAKMNELNMCLEEYVEYLLNQKSK